jgi:hypothetical protein
MARAVLGGAGDDGRSNYQIAINVCSECERATQRAGAAHATIDDVMYETASCDARHVGHVDAASPERAKQAVPPAVRRKVITRHEHRCAVPGCRHAAHLDVHHTELRSEGGTHEPELLVTLCSSLTGSPTWVGSGSAAASAAASSSSTPMLIERAYTTELDRAFLIAPRYTVTVQPATAARQRESGSPAVRVQLAAELGVNPRASRSKPALRRRRLLGDR